MKFNIDKYPFFKNLDSKVWYPKDQFDTPVLKEMKQAVNHKIRCQVFDHQNPIAFLNENEQEKLFQLKDQLKDNHYLIMSNGGVTQVCIKDGFMNMIFYDGRYPVFYLKFDIGSGEIYKDKKIILNNVNNNAQRPDAKYMRFMISWEILNQLLERKDITLKPKQKIKQTPVFIKNDLPVTIHLSTIQSNLALALAMASRSEEKPDVDFKVEDGKLVVL